MPSPTPERLNTPAVVAAVGDSITQSTGTGQLSVENPKNSWATGTDVYSVAARLSIPTAQRYNLSRNGARMTDFVGELGGKSGGSGDVAAAPATTGLVLVEFGGNDLCRDSVAEMTSVASYRTQFQAGLAKVKDQAPDALIQVMSVPDIYNLWYIRGGPQNATYHPEAESDQASGLNGARFYWGQSFFPCQSLLTSPDSYAAADRQRRLDVRTRDEAYNQVLETECAAVVRCRFDDSYLFDYTSNRPLDQPDGALLPQAQWRFTDNDISRNEGAGKFLCPVQGVVAGGCGDHFHPTKVGQGKVADAAWASGFDWSDQTVPTATAVTTTAPRGDGSFRGSAAVAFGGTDASGLKGQETRVQRPDGTVTPWVESIGLAPNRVVTDIGTSYVQVRSFDVNGNRSASTILAVTVVPPVVPTAPGTPAITATPTGLDVSWTAPIDDGGVAVTSYAVTTLADSPATELGTPVTVPGASTTDATPPAGRIVRYRVTATNSVGSSPASSVSPPTVAPFATLGAFVTQQYQDFAKRAPTSAELSAAIAGLTSGTVPPLALVHSLVDTPYWDGAYGPATRLYKAYFLRIPDPSGLDYWAGRRRAGRTLSSIAQGFAKSSEFIRRYGQLTDGAFVDTVYQNVFGRAPDPSGRAFYLGRLTAGWSRGRVVLQLSESSENIRHMAATVAVVELQRGLFGRAPTAADVALRGPTFTSGGEGPLFAELIGDPTYRTRVVH